MILVRAVVVRNTKLVTALICKLSENQYNCNISTVIR